MYINNRIIAAVLVIMPSFVFNLIFMLILNFKATARHEHESKYSYKYAPMGSV